MLRQKPENAHRSQKKSGSKETRNKEQRQWIENSNKYGILIQLYEQ